MKITITMTTGNDGFQTEPDVVEALERLAKRIKATSLDRVTKVMDQNGNSVGTVEVEKDSPAEDKTVSVIVADRRSSASYQETVEFTDMESLKTEVDAVIDRSGFGKVNVELEPSWDTTDEEQEALTAIEDG